MGTVASFFILLIKVETVATTLFPPVKAKVMLFVLTLKYSELNGKRRVVLNL